MSKPLTFIVMTAVRDMDDYASLASQAARLKPRGKVDVAVTSLSSRTLADIPPGGSPWHDYTSCLPALEKFVPHKDLEPFVDREHVRRNREQLAQSVAILRQHKLGAAAQFHIPWLLPEPFFEKHPHLRGPRIDHPRRSRREAFAMCADLPEGRAFYADMFRRFAEGIPELASIHLLTNDAGGGLCWADWQYPGPNGPGRCRHVDVGTRVRTLIDDIRKAAGVDRAIDFDLRGNFSDAELISLSRQHDDHFSARPQHGPPPPRHVAIGPYIDSPVLGLFDPVAMLKSLERVHTANINRIVIDFTANYSRGHELHDVQAKVIDLVDAYVGDPMSGLMNRIKLLRKLCARWVGEDQADALLETLYDLHDALNYRAATLPFFTANYAGMSMRHINRPLVAVPEKLSPEEESYWLPHVFNPSVKEARLDYIDFHGGRMTAPQSIDRASNPRVGPVATFGSRASGIADRLEKLEGAGADVFRRMGTSLRIYASIIRSIGNFYAAQRVRDRHMDKFASGETRTPPKLADWYGDPDLQLLNEFMRDELDNTTDLISLLEKGGMSQVLLAKDPADEDPFLLGPDLLNQLRMKCQIMRRHWLDAEQFLSSPHK